MNTIRTNARRADEQNVNEAALPQNPQVPIREDVMSNFEIRASIHSLIQVLATQVAWGTRVNVKPNCITASSRIMDFTRMNPCVFFCSKVEEDPQGFVDEVFNVVDAICVSSKRKRARCLSTKRCGSSLVFTIEGGEVSYKRSS